MHSSRLDWSGYLIGIALSGFFDGILLHQVLQWHHLLSLVPGAGDLRDQVLYDGLFHVLMYGIALAGILMLAGVRTQLARPGMGRRLFAALLLGFGGWNIADVAGFHWLLGIHHIKLDTANPILWDIGWLVVFGLVPFLLGWSIRRGGNSGIGGRITGMGAAVAVVLGGTWAAQPPANAQAAVVVFRPGTTQGEAVQAIERSGAYLLGHSRGVWSVKWKDGPQTARFYRNGALFVSSSLGGAGCLAWTQL